MTAILDKKMEAALDRTMASLGRNMPDILMEHIIREAGNQTGLKPEKQAVAAYFQKRFLSVTDSDMTDDAPSNRFVGGFEYITVSHEEVYKGTKPLWYVLGGERHDVTSWKHLLTDLCARIFAENRETFARAIEGVQGKRAYFALKRNWLRDGRPIKDSGIFVETNLSANNIKALCDGVYRFFGYGSKIQVKTWGRE